MKRPYLPLVMICAVAPLILFLWPLSSGQTSASPVLEDPTITPTDLSYLPFAAKSWPSTPIPESRPKLYGYASYRKLTNLPLMELGQYTNFIYTFHYVRAGWPDEADLQALRASGIQALLKLDRSVVEDAFDESALRELKARIDPYRDVIRALCVIDEPYRPSKHWTEQELEALVDRVKAIFPEYEMYVNFLAPYYTQMVTGEPFPNIPANIDLISTDIYIHLGETSGSGEYLMRIGRNLDIILDRAEGRPVFYFAPAYGMQDRPSSWPTVEQAWLDHGLYLDYGLAGLLWYFYEESATVVQGSMWGASHFPELLQAHQEIGEVTLGSQPPPILTPTPMSTPTRPTPTPLPDETMRWLIMRVNTSGGEPSCSEEWIAQHAFGPSDSINGAYSESSRGALNIAGDVTTVSVSGTINCSNRGTWATIADDEARAQGYNVGAYDRRAYVLPEGTCAWGGNVDLDTRRLYTDECSRPRVLAHELGHTIGTYHASTPDSEYGDLSCIMGGGNGAMVQFNAPHRVGLGWAEATTVTESGTYTLVATERDNHVILRVEKDNDEYYYLSFRAPIGEDADLGVEYLNRVSVHAFAKNPGGGVSSRSRLYATLGDGESFVDEIAGVTITMVSHQGDVAIVTIGL